MLEIMTLNQKYINNNKRWKSLHNWKETIWIEKSVSQQKDILERSGLAVKFFSLSRPQVCQMFRPMSYTTLSSSCTSLGDRYISLSRTDTCDAYLMALATQGCCSSGTEHVWYRHVNVMYKARWLYFILTASPNMGPLFPVMLNVGYINLHIFVFPLFIWIVVLPCSLKCWFRNPIFRNCCEFHIQQF